MCHLKKLALDILSLGALHYFRTSISAKSYSPLRDKAKKKIPFTLNLASFSKGIPVQSNYRVTASFATNLHFHLVSSAFLLHGQPNCTARTFFKTPAFFVREVGRKHTHVHSLKHH